MTVKLDAYATPDGGVRVIIPLPVSATGEPPTEMRLFSAGANDTTKGVYKFTAESAAAIMAEFADRAVEKMADYNHASIPQSRADGTERVPTAEEGRASCWYRLEVRGSKDAPELWAVGIRWTPDAAKYVTNRDYRYTSNAFLFDRKTLAITRYLNFGLVNDPAAKNLPALVAASDAGAALVTLRIEHKSDGWHVYSEDGANHLGGPYESKQQAVDRLSQIEGHKEKTSMNLSDKAKAAFKKLMDGDYADAGAMKKAMRAALAEADMEPDEDDKPMKKMSAILGCGADETAVLTSIGSLRSGQAEILALAGKATLGESVAVFRAAIQNAQTGATAVADLAKLANEKRLGDFDAAIEKAKAEMKLSPADLAADAAPAKYIATLRADAVNGFAGLTAYLSALTAKVTTTGDQKPAGEPVTVSEIDRALCAQLGTSIENIALLRAGKPLPKPEARK